LLTALFTGTLFFSHENNNDIIVKAKINFVDLI